ncbi:Fatty acid hydroperoxide dehydratase, partial [Gryllus bimaculatus]
MPLSVADARREGWVQAASGNTTSTWCLRDDPRVCVLYDLQGSVAGMQVSLPVADLQFKGNPYDVTAHPLFIRDRLFNMDVFTSRYFLYGVESHVKLREKTANFQKKLVLQGPGNEKVETLAAGGRRRAPGDEVGTGLWLQSGDDFVEVSRNADDLPAAHWSRENCVLEMGRHYYYNVSEQLPCEMAEPFFLLVDNRKDALHGVGFQIFGEASVKNRKWFESVPPYAVKSTLPNSPQCLTDWVKQYGLISLHII